MGLPKRGEIRKEVDLGAKIVIGSAFGFVAGAALGVATFFQVSNQSDGPVDPISSIIGYLIDQLLYPVVGAAIGAVVGAMVFPIMAWLVGFILGELRRSAHARRH